MAVGKLYDCLILGGGAAGLSTALGLGRVGRSCALFASERHRNEGVHHIHAILGSDHVDPKLFYERGRQQIEKYRNTAFIDTEITEVGQTKTDGSVEFWAKDARGRLWKGRTVVLATGVRDVLPDLEGYAANWPNNIYQCLFCDGWERRDSLKGILCYPSFNPMMAQMATMAHYMSPESPSSNGVTPATSRSKVTVFTNGPPDYESDDTTAKALETCAAHRIHIDTRKVVKLSTSHGKEGVRVHLENPDGSVSIQHVGFLFHKPSTELVAPHLFSQLGVELASKRAAKITAPFQATNIDGVFVAGDASTEMTHATNAMFTGIACAGGVAHHCNVLDDQSALHQELKC